MASTACLDERRKKCLCTGSNLGDAVASLGYNSQIGYARRLLGMRQQVQLNEFMQRGLDLEPQVAEAYAAFHDVEVEMAPFATLPADDRFGASGDYIATDPRTGEKIAVEIKTTRKDISPLTWLIPVNHLLQMLAQLKCFGLRRAHYVVYQVEDCFFRMWEVTFDDGLWDNVIWPRAKWFMDLIERKMLPPSRVPTSTKIQVTNAIYDGVTIQPIFFGQPANKTE